MSLITTHNLAKSYGPDDIFDGISVEIPHKARIALIGANGAGKTTLLNLLMGADVPTEGSVAMAKGLRIGFLPQRPEMHGDHTIWEEQLNAFAHLRELEAELETVQAQLADADEALMARYGELQHAFELADGYLYETRIKTVLQGVGFRPEQYHLPLSKLSGGQKTRTLLARLLLDAPDVLILDEPTNHLDIDAVEWLESYLREFSGAVLAVSHDRYFMDSFAQTIWEMEYGVIEVYRGNYTHYLRQREERHERLLKEYESQQEFIAKEEEYIRRNMAGQNTRQAQGRLKRLETMKKRGRVIARPRGKRRDMNLQMQAMIRSGKEVLITKNLAVGYPDADAPLFHVPDLLLHRGEIVALIGPNGTGKSTFLKTITQQLDPLQGEARLGVGVQIGYFAQAHELLNPKNSIIDEIVSVKPMLPNEARNFLGGFLFSGDDVFRTIETLSGGERGRVALAKLALTGANLLLLDEPTNHLDIDSQEVLQSVIADFNGTVILVTHDRYLVDALATQIWALRAREGKTEFAAFEGSYQEFLADRDKRKSPIATEDARTAQSTAQDAQQKAAQKAQKKHGLNPYQLKIRVEAVETQIHTLEQRMEEITAALESASQAGDSGKVHDLGAAYNTTEAELEAAMAEWERLLE